MRKRCYINAASRLRVGTGIELKTTTGLALTNNFLLSGFPGDLDFTPFVSIESVRVAAAYIPGTITDLTSAVTHSSKGIRR